MSKMFKSKGNIVIVSVILMLVIIIGTIGFSYSSETSKLKKENSEIQSKLTSAERTVSEYTVAAQKKDKEIEKYKAENKKLQSQVSSMKSENKSLKNQSKSNTSSTGKKTSKAVSTQYSKSTKEIISLLSLPAVKQQKQLPNVCYLTFDDGPSKNTPKILDTLKKYNVKATFFVIGSGNLDLLSRIDSEGHAIGLHSDTHDYAKIYSSTDNYLNDLKKISDKVYKKTGKRVQIIRFPGGSNNTVSCKYCTGIMTKLSKLLPEMGYNYIDWNVCAGDADKPLASVSEIVSNTLNRSSGRSSICVLLHDAPGKYTTPDALPKIIEGLVNKGYRFEIMTPSTNGYHFTVAN